LRLLQNTDSYHSSRSRASDASTNWLSFEEWLWHHLSSAGPIVAMTLFQLFCRYLFNWIAYCTSELPNLKQKENWHVFSMIQRTIKKS